MRLVFMGTPEFSVVTLKALIEAEHEIAAVYSQPPRPAGRGKQLRPSPVQAFAEGRSVPVHTPVSLKSADEQAKFLAFEADAAVVVAYGLILPRAILDAPRLGCFNVHASLLPRWRGAAPIQRAIMAGDAETGVSIMRMDAGLDTGPVCKLVKTPINADTTSGALHDELAALGARAMAEALAQGHIQCTEQPAGGVTYASKIDKAEARIDFARPAIELRRHAHGLSPYPGAWFELKGARIKVLRCEAVDQGGDAGVVLDDRLTIGCGQGALRLLELQREGKAPMNAKDFLRGFPIPKGAKLS
jgi:methionyl-tRNA formyltransferase